MTRDEAEEKGYYQQQFNPFGVHELPCCSICGEELEAGWLNPQTEELYCDDCLKEQ